MYDLKDKLLTGETPVMNTRESAGSERKGMHGC